MITVLRKGGLASDYGIPWILGYYIRNIISKDLKKNQIFSVTKKVISGGRRVVKMITTLHGGRGLSVPPKVIMLYVLDSL